MRPCFVFFVWHCAIFEAVRVTNDGAWELPVEVGPLARPHGEGVVDVAGGEGLVDVQRLLTTFDISGTLSQVRNITDELDRDKFHQGRHMGFLDRAWWVVEFEEGDVVLIKMWNGELDIFHNKEQVHKLNRENKPSTMLLAGHDSLLHSMTHARYFLQNWREVDHAQIGKRFVLQFTFVAAGTADPGSCRVHAKGAMSKAATTWYGLLKKQHLHLDEDDIDEEDESDFDEEDTHNADFQRAVLVGGSKGAEVLNLVLGLWGVMRDLEQLWSSWYLGTETQCISKLKERSLQRFQHLSQLIAALQDEDLKKIVKGWVSLWRQCMTQEGVAAANLAEAKQVPLLGLAVQMKSGEVVQVQNIIGSDDGKSFTISAVSTDNGFRRYTQQQWATNVNAIIDSKNTFGSIGAEVIRYGESFRILSEPQESRTVPIQGAKFARVRLLSPNANESVGLVDPECGEHHPFVGTHFGLLQKAYRGLVYEVVSVAVAVESKNIVLLRCKVVDDTQGVIRNLVDAYDAATISALMRNRQIRLDLPIKAYSIAEVALRNASQRTQKRLAIMQDQKYIQRHLIVTGARGTSLRVRRTAHVHNFHMFVVAPADRLHHSIVSKRTTELLKLTITDVFAPPEYEADDRAKRRRSAREMTINSIVALIMLAQVASSVTLAFIGVPVLLSQGSTAALAAMQASVLSSVSPILGLSMHLSPRGTVGGLAISGLHSYEASKIAFQTLNYAERMSSLALVSELCPLGSGLAYADFLKYRNETDAFYFGQFEERDEHGHNAYSACKRHTLSETDRRDLHRDENRKRQAQGQRPRLYSKFARDGHALGWFRKPTLEAKAARKFRASVFSMTQLARAIAYVTEQGCEVVANATEPQGYRLRERWTLTPRRD